MLIYDDVYTWKGPEVETDDASSLWMISCRLWMIDLSLSMPDVIHLKPVIVVASDLGNGPRRKICAESLGKQILSDFNLDIRRTLWIEHDPAIPGQMTVAAMKPKYFDGEEEIYSISWRKILPQEEKTVRKFITDFSSMAGQFETIKA